MNLTTTPTGLSPQRETGFSASPSSQLGWETLGWGEARVFHMPGGRGPGGPPASPRLPVTPPWRGPGTLRSRCTDRVPADARSQESAGERTRDRPPACGSRTPPRDPDTRPDVAPPRPARLRTWSTQCAVRTVAGSQDPVSTAAVLQNVLTKALFCNPRRPSTQPSAGYRCTGVVHSLGPLWVPKSLPS